MIHQIKLSNGQILQIKEGENCIHIAAMHEGEVDTYICEINPSGTLVMPNSGPAGEYLTNGLKLNDQPRTPIADAKICYTVDGENWLPAPEGMKIMRVRHIGKTSTKNIPDGRSLPRPRALARGRARTPRFARGRRFFSDAKIISIIPFGEMREHTH